MMNYIKLIILAPITVAAVMGLYLGIILMLNSSVSINFPDLDSELNIEIEIQSKLLMTDCGKESFKIPLNPALIFS